jgi:hypothetical protein
VQESYIRFIFFIYSELGLSVLNYPDENNVCGLRLKSDHGLESLTKIIEQNELDWLTACSYKFRRRDGVCCCLGIRSSLETPEIELMHKISCVIYLEK